MDDLKSILEKLERGEIRADEAQKLISSASIANLSHTRIDLDRRVRTGAGEVIFGAGKTPGQICEISKKLLECGEDVLATRLSDDAISEVLREFPQAKVSEIARLAVIRSGEKAKALSESKIAVVSAGTSDMRVAEEARLTAEFFGSSTRTFYDCGVAGLHRLTSVIDEIRECRVVVAVAGMEGALASVVAGLVKVPVIAAPTSVGYGASFGGLAALLAMMNSCANGVSVVNIDNGFGAGYNAHIINTL